MDEMVVTKSIDALPDEPPVCGNCAYFVPRRTGGHCHDALWRARRLIPNAVIITGISVKMVEATDGADCPTHSTIKR